jgi:hypothetical protein
MYDGEYSVYHPNKRKLFDAQRAYVYGLGYGALFKKIVFYYKKHHLLYKYVIAVIKNIGAILISTHKRYYIYALRGKLVGFIQYSINKR